MSLESSSTPNLVKRDIREINLLQYGFSDVGILCEPSAEDICRAINEDKLEARNFQHDLLALQAEWLEKSQGGANREELRKLGTEYHAQRIAYFVVNGWEDLEHPIRIDEENNLHDGGHRIRAASFKGLTEVDVIITS